MNSIKQKERKFSRFLSFDFWIENTMIVTLILLFILFILYPMLGVLIRSFKEGDLWTLDNYRDLLNTRNLALIRNSIFVASLSSLIATLIATSIGIFGYFKSKRIRGWLYRGLMMTMISPPFISAIAIITLFGRRGLITHGLLGLSLNPYGWHGIVILQSISGVSLSAIMIMTGLSQIDSRMIMAARDLGAGRIQTLKNIVMPLIRPSILSVLFLQFTMNISDFTTPIIIGGRYKVLATEAYMRVYSQANLGGAAAMTTLLLPPSILAFYFYRKNISKGSTMSDRARIMDGGGVNFKLPISVEIFTGAITFLFFSFMALRYGNIFLSALTRNVSGSLEFTLDHLQVFQRRHLDALVRTLYMSVVAGFFSTLFGIMLSYYTQRRRLAIARPVEFVASLPYIVPGIFFGLGYIVVFHSGAIALTGTTLILILNCTFRHVSVGNKAANASFETLDEKLELASYDLGATKTRTLVTIILPILKSTFLLSFISAFTACMTTVGPLILLVSPRNLVLSVLMFNEINSGRYGQSAVMGCAIMIITFGVNLMAIYITAREKRVKN